MMLKSHSTWDNSDTEISKIITITKPLNHRIMNRQTLGIGCLDPPFYQLWEVSFIVLFVLQVGLEKGDLIKIICVS